jgi:hypothetical protein
MERISRARKTTMRSLADVIISIPVADSSSRAGYSTLVTPSRRR